MYFWKCWRDTRSFFIAFVIIAATVVPITALVCMGTGLIGSVAKFVAGVLPQLESTDAHLRIATGLGENRSAGHPIPERIVLAGSIVQAAM
jgi:hypothetical protein